MWLILTPPSLPHRNNVPTIQIGKNGLTESLFNELKDQLKIHRAIRVRILKNAPFEDRKMALTQLEQNLPSSLKIVEKKGWTAIIEKK